VDIMHYCTKLDSNHQIKNCIANCRQSEVRDTEMTAPELNTWLENSESYNQIYIAFSLTVTD